MKFSSLIVAMSAVVFSASLSAQVAPNTMASCLSTEIVEFDGNIVEAAVATPSLSTLVTAVEVAGLVDTLATAEGITVYAPTNAAFDKVPADALNALLADKDALTAVLLRHVVPSAALQVDVQESIFLFTLIFLFFYKIKLWFKSVFVFLI